jgi:hypothetical protein
MSSDFQEVKTSISARSVGLGIVEMSSDFQELRPPAAEGRLTVFVAGMGPGNQAVLSVRVL